MFEILILLQHGEIKTTDNGPTSVAAVDTFCVSVHYYWQFSETLNWFNAIRSVYNCFYIFSLSIW